MTHQLETLCPFVSKCEQDVGGRDFTASPLQTEFAEPLAAREPLATVHPDFSALLNTVLEDDSNRGGGSGWPAVRPSSRLKIRNFRNAERKQSNGLRSWWTDHGLRSKMHL